jgi:hypothetical protein
MLDHYHYRRWYRTTTRTDFCCFHLQLNQHLAAFLQRHKHKERTASGGMYGPRLRSHVRPQTPVTYEQDNCRASTPTDRQEFVPIRLRIRPRCWHYTATRTTPSLVPYYYLHRQLIVPIRIRSTTDRTIVPIRLRSNDQLIDRAPNVRPTITT